MPSMSAENYSRQGLFALREGRHKAAADLFRQALDLDKERNRRTPEMRYLSYYGLSLAKAGLSTQFALKACRRDGIERVTIEELERIRERMPTPKLFGGR